MLKMFGRPKKWHCVLSIILILSFTSNVIASNKDIPIERKLAIEQTDFNFEDDSVYSIACPECDRGLLIETRKDTSNYARSLWSDQQRSATWSGVWF